MSSYFKKLWCTSITYLSAVLTVAGIISIHTYKSTCYIQSDDNKKIKYNSKPVKRKTQITYSSEYCIIFFKAMIHEADKDSCLLFRSFLLFWSS